MVIYGVALLAFCMLIGVIVGNLLGIILGVNADVGGVGFAMLLLIYSSTYLEKKGILKIDMKQGITFWSAMYIPIVVAMGATQNVILALSGSFLAIVTGVFVTFASLLLVPVISRIGGKPLPLPTLVHVNKKDVNQKDVSPEAEKNSAPTFIDHPISHLNPLLQDNKEK